MRVTATYPMKQQLMFWCILLFAGLFMLLNIPNMRSVYRLTFVTPFSDNSAMPPSPVKRIQLTDRGHRYQESFIAQSVITPDNRSAYFFSVPDSVDFSTSQVTLNDKKIALKESFHQTAIYEDEQQIIYFLRESNPTEMIARIQADGLQVVQPPRP